MQSNTNSRKNLSMFFLLAFLLTIIKSQNSNAKFEFSIFKERTNKKRIVDENVPKKQSFSSIEDPREADLPQELRPKPENKSQNQKKNEVGQKPSESTQKAQSSVAQNSEAKKPTQGKGSQSTQRQVSTNASDRQIGKNNNQQGKRVTKRRPPIISPTIISAKQKPMWLKALTPDVFGRNSHTSGTQTTKHESKTISAPRNIKIGFLKTSSKNYAIADFICTVLTKAFTTSGFQTCTLKSFDTGIGLIDAILHNDVQLSLLDNIDLVNTIHKQDNQPIFLEELKKIKSITSLYGKTITFLTNLHGTIDTPETLKKSYRIGIMQKDRQARIILQHMIEASKMQPSDFAIHEFFHEYDAIRSLKTKGVDSFIIYSSQPNGFIERMVEHGRAKIVKFSQDFIQEITDINPCQQFFIKQSTYPNRIRSKKSILTPLYITELVGSANINPEFAQRLASAISKDIEEIYEIDKNVIIPSKDALKICNAFEKPWETKAKEAEEETPKEEKIKMETQAKDEKTNKAILQEAKTKKKNTLVNKKVNQPKKVSNTDANIKKRQKSETQSNNKAG